MSTPQAGKVVLELRVHGVRGTPTASMLGVDDGDVVQVAGDRLTGFYRIRGAADPPLRKLPTGMALEAYSWGELTSGVRGVWGWITRVLWLMLLPFALVNLAFWARQDVGRDTGQARWGLRAVRVSGLLLTVIGMLTVSFVSVDLVAWQCYRANAVACPALPDAMDTLATLVAGRRIAVMSIVPLLVVGLLVALTSQSMSRYEATADHPDQEALDVRSGECEDCVLEHPKMWHGERRTRHLLHLHVAVSLATIVLFTGVHLWARGATGGIRITTIAAGVVVLAALVRTLTVDEDDLEHRGRWHLWTFGRRWEISRDHLRWLFVPGEVLRRFELCWLVRVALVVTALHLVALWFTELPAPTRTSPVAPEEMSWFGTNVWFIGLFIALAIVHVIVFVGSRTRLFSVLLITVALLLLVWRAQELGTGERLAAALGVWVLLVAFHVHTSRRAENRPLAWGGTAASILLGAATVVALLFTSAAVVGTANFLNGERHSVADLITKRNEQSPLSAEWETVPLRLAGDVVLEGARVVGGGEAVVVTDGTIRTDALSRPSKRDPDTSYAMASTMVRSATLLLPDEATSVRLTSSCFTRRETDAAEPCTGESSGFRTAGDVEIATTCEVEGEQVPCLQVEAAHGRVELAVTDPPQTPLVVPQILVWTPLMLTLSIVLGLLVTGYLVVMRFHRRAAGPVRDLVDTDRPEVPEQDRAAVKQARVGAALAHRAERILDVVGAVVTCVAVSTLALSSGGDPPWVLAQWSRSFATLSLYVALVLSVGIMMLGAQIRRSPTARRNVGVLWDITTFWPRSAHPFAPPCYAERVVPEITARVRWALAEDAGRVVVLSGHSQGSLICVAVASRLTDKITQVRLLTYGSQIRALYGRVFPAAAGPRALGYVPTVGATRMDCAFPDVPSRDARVPRRPETREGLRYRLSSPDDWVNLFRRSDPLGYRVFSDRDHPTLDRVTLEVRPGGSGDPGSLVMTHGGYQHTPEYREAIAEWTHEQVQQATVGPVTVVPLPPA